MNNNEFVENALAQARDMQKNVAEALNRTAENMQPLLRESMENARVLQETLAKHAQESGSIAQEQTQKALVHLQEFMQIGAAAVTASAQQARTYAQQMMEQSKASAEAAREAMGKKPGEGP